MTIIGSESRESSKSWKEFTEDVEKNREGKSFNPGKSRIKYPGQSEHTED